MKHYAPNIYMLAPKDNLEMRCQSQKRGIIQSNSNRILPKVNQVIYTLDTICVPNIMILAQAGIQIFCWQGSIGVQWVSRKRGMIQSNIHRILRKVNQVIWIMYSNTMPDIMILAQAEKNMGPLIFHADSTSNFKILSLTVLDRIQSVTDKHTDRPKPICPLNFFDWSKGHKKHKTHRPGRIIFFV